MNEISKSSALKLIKPDIVFLRIRDVKQEILSFSPVHRASNTYRLRASHIKYILSSGKLQRLYRNFKHLSLVKFLSEEIIQVSTNWRPEKILADTTKYWNLLRNLPHLWNWPNSQPQISQDQLVHHVIQKNQEIISGEKPTASSGTIWENDISKTWKDVGILV